LVYTNTNTGNCKYGRICLCKTTCIWSEQTKVETHVAFTSECQVLKKFHIKSACTFILIITNTSKSMKLYMRMDIVVLKNSQVFLFVVIEFQKNIANWTENKNILTYEELNLWLLNIKRQYFTIK